MNAYVKEILKKYSKEVRVNFYDDIGRPYILTSDEFGFIIYDVMCERTYNESDIGSTFEELEKFITAIIELRMNDGEIEDKELLPEYYDFRGLKCKDIQEAFSKIRDENEENKQPKYMAYYENNVLKYLYRYPRKNGIEDLRKARTYLSFMISCLTTSDNREDKDE